MKKNKNKNRKFLKLDMTQFTYEVNKCWFFT